MGREADNLARRLSRVNNHSNEKGMALVALLIATTMISLTCIGLIDIFTMHSKTRALTSASAKRDSLLLQLRREGRVGLNLYASIEPSQLPINDELKRHIIYQNGDTPYSCSDLRWSPNVYHPMRLIADSGSKLAGTGGTDFAFYDEDGKVCVAGGKPCVMQVSASFGCYCNDGMGWWDGSVYRCNIAKGIDIRFTVEPRAGSGYQVSKRTVSQYVPIQDWGFGQWSLITFNKDITVRPTHTPDPNATPVPVPTASPIPSGPSGGASGPPASATPAPPPPTPTPLPPPVPSTASCDPGQTVVNGACVGFSM
jgi:type II secretory pathway pseudopilin PulG